MLLLVSEIRQVDKKGIALSFTLEVRDCLLHMYNGM